MVDLRKKWGHANFTLLPPLSKLVFIYLASNPTISTLGVLELLPEVVITQLRIESEELYAALEELNKVGMIYTVPGQEPRIVVIIKAHYNSLNKSKANIRKGIDEGKSSPYRAHLRKLYTKDDFTSGTNFKPPTPAEVSQYALENGHLVDGRVFVDHYASNDWYNRNDKKVRNWKATCLKVWCRDENKIESPEGAPEGFEHFYVQTEEGEIIVPEGWTEIGPTHGSFLKAQILKEEYAKQKSERRS